MNVKEEVAADKRGASRKRVLWPGMIVYGEGNFTCDCKLRSVSDTGVRIALTHLAQFPDSFYVINFRDAVAYQVTVVWNKGLELGLRLEATLALNSKVSPTLKRLKRLWAAKAPH